MAGAIGPGDWVERIECGPFARSIGCAVGDVHKVLSVALGGPCPCGRGCVFGLNLSGLDNGLFGWCPRCFRPIYRPKSELLESLLHKADEPLKVDA